MRAPLFGLACLLSACIAEIGDITPPLQPPGTPPPAPPGVPPPAGCVAAFDPGRPTLHRLNRAEYNNTVRDLVGDTTRPGDDFPADDHGYGFDNIGDVLSASPLLVEKYEIAGDRLVKETLAAAPGPLGRRFEAETVGSDVGVVDGDAWNLYSNGEIAQTITIEVTGEYELAVRAFGQQAGADPVRMELRVDAAMLRAFDVSAPAAAPEVYRVRQRLDAGAHRIAVAFTNDLYDPDLMLDRNLIVDWLEYSGPHDAPIDPQRRARIMTCDPAASSQEVCAREIFAGFGKRAWRRPLSSEELDRLVALAGVAWTENDPFDVGIGLGLQALMLSPHFVFRVELDPDPTATDPHPLGAFELAARLSYFVWSSTPDDALLARAESGELLDPAVIAAEVRRMLGDPRASALVENFGGQWLYTRALADVNPDYAKFPSWDESLRRSMAAETKAFFTELLTTDRSALDLVDSDFSYLDDRLAQHYGLPAVGSSTVQRVSLPAGERGGILTQGSFLAVTSHPRRTSPVKRGKWVLEQLLCSKPPDPPANVGALPEPVNPTASLRERFEQHRSRDECRSCHEVMDPIGFALEHYDAIGAWRDDDEGFAIDATGTLPGGVSFDGGREMARVIRADPRLPKCMTRQMFTYALGRGPTAADACGLDAIQRSFEGEGHRFDALIRAIATSPAFTARRGEPVR